MKTDEVTEFYQASLHSTSFKHFHRKNLDFFKKGNFQFSRLKTSLNAPSREVIN